jgi:hypothetical protein
MTKKTTKKTATKTATKTTKKAATKKTTKKVASKPTKKVTTKRAAAKTVKKTATKKKTTGKPISKTTIAARVDVGFGNNLYIRGEGAGLSWDVGILMKNLSPYEWAWENKGATKPIEYKFIINDEIWANGGNLFAKPGETSISAPTFNW